MEWFSVNKTGLAKILKERGYAFLIHELIQNALDTDSPTVRVGMVWKRGKATVGVEDEHPEGFSNLTHAWTLFAESEKKGDPTKRGRFNLGEKLVLAVCSWAEISTTKGMVRFDHLGRRKTRTKRPVGSEFVGEIPMLKSEFDEMMEAARAVIAPKGKILTVNGVEVERPELRAEIDVKALDTVTSGDDGQLKRTRRNTQIHVYAVGPDETPYIHEMGIPVCPLEDGDPWHLDVQQKIPLTLDRSSVSSAFLRKVRLAVLNVMFGDLDEDQANTGWVRETAKEEEVQDGAIERILNLRFGEKRVAYDPNDQEANKLAVSKGYTLVTGSQLSKEEWRNAKRGGFIHPAGQVTPSNSKITNNPDGEDDTYPEDKITDAMRCVVTMMTRLGSRLVDNVTIHLASRRHEGSRAWYGSRTMSLNVARLGRKWFERVAGQEARALEDCYDLLIHELGHEFSDDHLSSDYHNALTKLGAKLTLLALDEPDLFLVPEVSRAG